MKKEKKVSYKVGQNVKNVYGKVRKVTKVAKGVISYLSDKGKGKCSIESFKHWQTRTDR